MQPYLNLWHSVDILYMMDMTFVLLWVILTSCIPQRRKMLLEDLWINVDLSLPKLLCDSDQEAILTEPKERMFDEIQILFSDIKKDFPFHALNKITCVND